MFHKYQLHQLVALEMCFGKTQMNTKSQKCKTMKVYFLSMLHVYLGQAGSSASHLLHSGTQGEKAVPIQNIVAYNGRGKEDGILCSGYQNFYLDPHPFSNLIDLSRLHEQHQPPEARVIQSYQILITEPRGSSYSNYHTGSLLS